MDGLLGVFGLTDRQMLVAYLLVWSLSTLARVLPDVKPGDRLPYRWFSAIVHGINANWDQVSKAIWPRRFTF